MWYCSHCKTRMKGTLCGNRWRNKDGLRCQEVFEPSAERFPRLDGMIFINDDGTGVPRLEQKVYEMYKQGGAKRPRSVQGPRPCGWDTAMDAIGARCIPLMVGELPEC
jgi:hypothetical protein